MDQPSCSLLCKSYTRFRVLAWECVLKKTSLVAYIEHGMRDMAQLAGPVAHACAIRILGPAYHRRRCTFKKIILPFLMKGHGIISVDDVLRGVYQSRSDIWIPDVWTFWTRPILDTIQTHIIFNASIHLFHSIYFQCSKWVK